MLHSKQRYFSALTLGLLLLTISGFAHAAADELGITKDNNFVTTADIRVASFGKDQNSILPAGTGITVLETKQDARLGTLVHLGVDSDDASLPADTWVSMSEFSRAGLGKVDELDLTDAEDGTSSSWFLDARGGMTYCYRYVKLYLLKTGLVKHYLPGVSARMAVDALPDEGFHLVDIDREDAIINDVCVYSGGRGNNGHIEVRVKGGWYWGYGVKSHPISLRNHELLGCYRKDVPEPMAQPSGREQKKKQRDND